MTESDRNAGVPAPDHFYTWVDVDRHFADLARTTAWPGWLLEVAAYWDCVRMVVRGGTAADTVWDFLSESLGPLTIDRAGQSLLLDTARTGRSDRRLAVELDHTDDEVHVPSQPRWRTRRVVAEDSVSQPDPGPIPHDIPVCVFHSFKGGVGRTLHCVATAQELAKGGQRVLLVDADLEAPGITWMWQAQSLRFDFAFEDFLALVHGAEDDSIMDALDLGQHYLSNQEIDGVIVMPSGRRHKRVEPPLIEPVNLLSAGRNPFLLTDALALLAHRLGAHVVIADLRAGISELSAPLLLDARTNRVLVTTVSDQSVQGTRLVLDELARRSSPRTLDQPDVITILTQFDARNHRDRLEEVANELRAATMRASGIDQVTDSSADADAETLTDHDSRRYIVTSPFAMSLLNLPPNWSAVTSLIERTGIPSEISLIVETLQAESSVDLAADRIPEQQDSDRDTMRRSVADAADKLVYAEQTISETGFLATDALANLAESHQTDVPIEVVIGAKGSGKTFTYLQVCNRRYWSEFVNYLYPAASSGDKPTDHDTGVLTVPVIQSRNLDQRAADLLATRREQVAASLGHEAPPSILELRDLVSAQLNADADDTVWRRTWLTCFARSIGLSTTPEQAQEALTEFARSNSVLFVVDGLEDLFQNFTEDHGQQRALRVLLTDCAEWFRSLRGRPLGLLTFIRRDLAQAAITQNFAQFETRHSNYALRWNRDEALRLAAWVCKRGGALPDRDEAEIRDAGPTDLTHWMMSVWGDKMGSARSKEARCEQWFSAALSDFGGQIQARDIVIFISNAASRSIGDNHYPDRLLVPSAMRRALPECSRIKIEAIRAENEPVGKLLARLREAPESQRQVPFTLDSVGIDAREARLLETNGILFRENDQYWIPEIFRHGLQFTAKGRPRILAIANLVRKRNDLGT